MARYNQTGSGTLFTRMGWCRGGTNEPYTVGSNTDQVQFAYPEVIAKINLNTAAVTEYPTGRSIRHSRGDDYYDFLEMVGASLAGYGGAGVAWCIVSLLAEFGTPGSDDNIYEADATGIQGTEAVNLAGHSAAVALWQGAPVAPVVNGVQTWRS